MTLAQHPPLAFCHAAPDAELHLIVQRVGQALDGDRTVPADDSGFPLRGSSNEELIGIG